MRQMLQWSVGDGGSIEVEWSRVVVCTRLVDDYVVVGVAFVVVHYSSRH